MTAPTNDPPESFTSDLTVDELVVLTDAGWEQIAFVSGDCASDPGDGYWSPSGNQGDALTRGQSSAMERMRQQAAAVGATGIVGVRLRTTHVEVSRETLSLSHFSALGTAVRLKDEKPRRGSVPFTSHLTGQDTWALVAAGCKPLGMVFGTGFYRPKRLFQRQTGFQEVNTLTQGVYAAREQAMHHMQTQAAALHATGIVGVSIKMSVAHQHNVTFTAIGTAITTPTEPEQLALRPAVDLTDRSPGASAHQQRPVHGTPPTITDG